jgi:glycosyltransferase involved in cell wall biosynthesis
VPKLDHAKVILDIHDIVPELYAAKFGVSHSSLMFRALVWVERLSAGFADHVIAANDIWLERLTSRSVRRDKCSAFINYPDPSIFRRGLRTRRPDGRFVMLYPGTLNWHQGLDIAIRAFAIARLQAPAMEFHIYGEGSATEDLHKLVQELDLVGQVQLHEPLPLRHISAVMANADLGLVPKRNDGFGGEAFSTKTLEFMALGIPLVVADTAVDRHYFDDSLVRFFKAADVQSLAESLLDAYSERGFETDRTKNALAHASENNWGTKKSDYLAVVDGLIGARVQSSRCASTES